MREPGGLARHAAQAKAARGAVVGDFQPPVVEREALMHAILQIQLAIVAHADRLMRQFDRALGRQVTIKVVAGVHATGDRVAAP